MKTVGTILTALLICGFITAGWKSLGQQKAPPSSQPSASHRLADSMQRKIDHIEQNADRPRPDQTPTVMTEEEINDYLASGHVKLPQGVKKVRLQGQTGRVDAFLTVDFDEIREGQRSANPLLGIFSGTHNVTVESDATGAGGQGKVHVRTVSLDGMEVPRVALEYFVSKYVTSKYPNLGMDSQFELPEKIDTATVGYHKLTVTQK
jgi:hypothetical protein